MVDRLRSPGEDSLDELFIIEAFFLLHLEFLEELIQLILAQLFT